MLPIAAGSRSYGEGRNGFLGGMRVSKSLEEIWRIEEKISGEIAGMSHEEIIRYFRERRPSEIGPLRRFEKPETVRPETQIDHS
jgi:hypothetical protein